MKTRLIPIALFGLAVAAATTLADGAQHVTQTFAFQVEVPCIGETLTVTGTAHVLSRIASDGNGGFHARIHFDARGQAVDSRGVVWEWIDQRNVIGRVSADGQDSLDFRSRNGMLVARGGGARFIMFDGTLHVLTVNGNVVHARLVTDPGRCE